MVAAILLVRAMAASVSVEACGIVDEILRPCNQSDWEAWLKQKMEATISFGDLGFNLG